MSRHPLLMMAIGGTLVLAAVVARQAYRTAADSTAAGATYYCPMHPQITSARPGDCPICNMRLVPRPAALPTAPTAASTPKPPSPPPSPTISTRWQCPMHPQIIAEEKGTCPICTMPLQPMPPPPVLAAEANSQKAAPPVSGYVPLLMDAPRRQLLGVRIESVRRVQLSGTLRTSGRLTFDETRVHHVHTRYEAYVEAVYADFTGKYVKKGEPLLSLYSPELLTAQTEFLIALRSRGSTLPHAPELPGGTSALLEAARQKLQLLQVSPADIMELERSGQASEAVRVYAPISGYVIGKLAVHGMKARPEDSLFDIVDLSRLWVLADVYESDLPRLQLGLTATITLPYWPGRSWSARVSYIYPMVDPKTRTVKVRLEVENPRADLKAEMYADVQLTSAPRSALVVSEDAVIETGVRALVFVQGPGDTLQPREVGLGGREGGLREIKSGLREGEPVARGASFLLDSESRLQSAISGMGTEPGAAKGP